MQNEVEYLRGRLADARKVRGRIAQIGRAIEVDRRTLDKLSDPSHTPHANTIDKLLAYFRKLDKKAAKEEEVKA